jgi:PIN domain nuclease of toxin-antitoxin system
MLLDTQIYVALLREEAHLLAPALRQIVLAPPAPHHVSTVSLWEIAIKFRLGKLELKIPLDELLALTQGIGLILLMIEPSHVLASVDPLPDTRDPFDRLLLAQCAVEGLRLVTLDRVLSRHPLAWRA